MSKLLVLLFAVAMPVWAQATQEPPTPAVSPTAIPNKNIPMHIEGLVEPPIVIYSEAPKFTDQARALKPYEATVKVYLWVDEHGLPSHVRVVQGVGYGLDESAVTAIRTYRFKPATLNGNPVKVDIYIDVNFKIK